MNDRIVDPASTEPCIHCCGTGKKLKVDWKTAFAWCKIMTAQRVQQFFRMAPDETLVFVEDLKNDIKGVDSWISNIELKVVDGDIHIIGH
jgi:hypothetical protein